MARKLISIDDDLLKAAKELQAYMNVGKEPEESWRLDSVLAHALERGLSDWLEQASEAPDWTGR